MKKRDKELIKSYEEFGKKLLKLEEECAEVGDIDGMNFYKDAVKANQKNIEDIQSKYDKRFENALKIVGVSTGVLTASAGIIVPLIVSKNQTAALEKTIALSWLAQTSGEVPTKITSELTNQAIKNFSK